MPFGSLVGGGAGWLLGGPVGAAVGASLGAGFDSQQSARDAEDFSREQYATRYQTQVRDMMAAGLNPMLAYTQGPGSAPTGVSQQYDGGSTAQAMLQGLQQDKIRADIAAVKATTAESAARANLILAQTNTEVEHPQLVRLDRELREDQVRTQRQETLRVQTERDRLAQQAQLLVEQVLGQQYANSAAKYELVRKGQEARFYDSNEWYVPAERVATLANSATDAVSNLIPRSIVRFGASPARKGK